jgi:MFS family permease
MTGHRPTSDKSTADKLLLGAALFLSGFLVMTYEVSWHRMLSLSLGATLRSAALVLSAYMMGMGFGAWLFGRLADRTAKPSRHLAWLHWALALSGLWGLALISAIPAVYRAAGGGPAVEAAVHLMAVLALLPGAAPAGGMMPATARAYIRRKAGLGRGIGTLYALEALGSVAGGAAAGYLMIRSWARPTRSLQPWLPARRPERFFSRSEAAGDGRRIRTGNRRAKRNGQSETSGCC